MMMMIMERKKINRMMIMERKEMNRMMIMYLNHMKRIMIKVDLHFLLLVELLVRHDGGGGVVGGLKYFH